MISTNIEISLNFNPRSRMGSDISHSIKSSVESISIHAPAWGATRLLSALSTPKTDFNPRSRMGSDQFLDQQAVKPKISIHAPAWGATNEVQGDLFDLPISIHAPAWGATCSC